MSGIGLFTWDVTGLNANFFVPESNSLDIEPTLAIQQQLTDIEALISYLEEDDGS
jgi:hypothetical protein